MRDPAVYIGLVVLDPQYLRRSPAGEGRVCRYLNKPVASDYPVHFLDLGCCSLVTPNYRIAQDVIVLIEHDKTVHLSRNADALNVVFAHAACRHDSLYRIYHRICPVLRLLFGIAVFGLIHGIFYRLGGDNASLFVKQDCLCTARTAVHAYNV